MIISVSESGADAKSRVVAIRLASLTLRCMENWAKIAGGYDEAMILVAVVAITSERLVRAGLPAPLENLKEPLPPEMLGTCNIASIASATGINRETARRKVAALIESGLLDQPTRGNVRFPVGRLQQNAILELVRAQLAAFSRAADAFAHDGALVVQAEN